MAPPPPIQGPPFPDISPIAKNCDGVAQLLTTLDLHKATGPDHIPSRLLKEISSEIVPSLILIFQASLHQCSIPSNWKEVLLPHCLRRGTTVYLVTTVLYL